MDHPRGGARDLSEALAARAEDLCRRYLPGGRRNGAYWTVGDVHGTPGRSLFVRLVGPASGRGAAGRWCDAATGQRGDLLDLIALNRGHARLRDAMDEARSVLALPPVAPRPATQATASVQRADTVDAANRLYRAGWPIRGTPAELYLAARGIALDDPAADVLRFHPAACYRDVPSDPRRTLPALLAPVTDLAGTLTGLHRTFIDPQPGRGADTELLGKAPVASPRRSLGRLAGHGVRLRRGDGTVWLVGEGIETALSLAPLFPWAGVVAALSASQLAILVLPPGLARLVIARDNDAAGRGVAERLAGRARALSIAVSVLRPRLIDFNADLRRWGWRAWRSGSARNCRAREGGGSQERGGRRGRRRAGRDTRAGTARPRVPRRVARVPRARPSQSGDPATTRPSGRNGGAPASFPGPGGPCREHPREPDAAGRAGRAGPPRGANKPAPRRPPLRCGPGPMARGAVRPGRGGRSP